VSYGSSATLPSQRCVGGLCCRPLRSPALVAGAAARSHTRACAAPEDARTPPPAEPGGDASTVGEPLPLAAQLEGEKEGSESFITSQGVVQDVEEEEARVRGTEGGKPAESRVVAHCRRRPGATCEGQALQGRSA
jgi:hypothetical protein